MIKVFICVVTIIFVGSSAFAEDIYSGGSSQSYSIKIEDRISDH